MRLSGTKTTAIHQYRGLGNQLWDLAGNRPSLDLRFADEKSLVDATTGTNLVDHTRASSGTYVGSDGLIKTATTNYFLNSETFATTWNRTGILAFGSGSTEDAIAAPNGSITADFLGEDTSTGRHRISSGISFIAGVTYTLSIFAKSSNRNIYINAGVAFGGSAGFNLQTGTVAVNTGSASIENVGNGWYRCSVSGTASSTATPSIFFQIQTGVIDENYTGDGTSGIYLWGAQLEQSSTVGEYIPTTSTINSAPRFDHDPTTGESLGLLVEESRANISPYSSYVAGQWAFQAASLGTSTRTSPTGSTVTAFLADNTTTAHRVIRSISGSYTANTLYTFSFYVAKPSSSDILGIIARIRTSAGGQAVGFAVSDQGEQSSYTFSGCTPFGGSPPAVITSDSVSITDVGNNWTRIAITAAISNANTTLTQWDIGFSTTSGTDIGAGTANSELFIDLVQLEVGSFPTSYIPTEGTTVTRAADVADISGSNYSSWANNSEGTVFTRFSSYPQEGLTLFCWSLYEDGANHLALRSATGYTPDRIFNISRVSNSNTFSGESNANGYITVPANDARNAFAYKTNSFSASWNGGTSFSSSSGALPAAPSQFTIGSLTGSSHLCGHIRRLTYWPQRLSNEVLQRITQ